MLKVLSYILCDLDPKLKVIGVKAGICDGVPSTSALVCIYFMDYHLTFKKKKQIGGHQTNDLSGMPKGLFHGMGN